jgi:hypothetical protein
MKKFIMGLENFRCFTFFSLLNIAIIDGNRIKLTPMEKNIEILIIQPKSTTGLMLQKSKEANPTTLVKPA